jgi:hypothetical protein
MLFGEADKASLIRTTSNKVFVDCAIFGFPSKRLILVLVDFLCIFLY